MTDALLWIAQDFVVPWAMWILGVITGWFVRDGWSE